MDQFARQHITLAGGEETKGSDGQKSAKGGATK
jgi:hypothetical protein